MSSNNPNRVYLDTETTGLHPEEGDEILSLTIVDANGRLLFDERFKPKHKKGVAGSPGGEPHFPDDVEHLTTIDAYMEQICRILDRIADEIVGYNIAFDIGFLKAAGATINPDAAIIDTMQEFMDAFGNSNTGHRYQPLSMAAERLGYNWTSAPHGSLSDTLACLAAQKCVDDHNWCVENLELTEDAIMHAKPIENGSEGLPKRLLGPQPRRPPVCRHGADSPSAPELCETLRTSRYHHPVHAHDRQPVVRQSGTVTAKPARPVCRYRTRGKCLEQPA